MYIYIQRYNQWYNNIVYNCNIDNDVISAEKKCKL